MNLDRALVLLLASVSAVAGFTPCRPASFAVRSQQSAGIVKTALFSEVEEATEAPAEAPVEAAAAPAAAEYDTSIYVGNISFGEFDSDVLEKIFLVYGRIFSSTHLSRLFFPI